MQRSHPEDFRDLSAIESVRLEISKPLISHCGWKATTPITSTGAQMNASYIAAVQLVDREVLLEQFADDKLERDEVWTMVGKTTCEHNEHFDRLTYEMGSVVTIKFNDSRPDLETMVEKPRGVDPAITNGEIVQKYRRLTATLLSKNRQRAIEETVLNLEKLADVTKLTTLLSEPFKSEQQE
jgi:aconitate decarboxylase